LAREEASRLPLGPEDIPKISPWFVENGKIKEFNCYVNVNVMLEQMGIQPDFASAVKAQPGSTRRATA
jgi:hypothetical protein